MSGRCREFFECRAVSGGGVISHQRARKQFCVRADGLNILLSRSAIFGFAFSNCFFQLGRTNGHNTAHSYAANVAPINLAAAVDPPPAPLPRPLPSTLPNACCTREERVGFGDDAPFGRRREQGTSEPAV